MNQNMYYTEEHEIDIRTLLWKLLLRWKWILLFAIIFAILGYGYAKYKRAEQREAIMANAPVETGNITEDFINYDETESNIYEVVRRYETALNRERKYANQSLLMQLDPYHVISTTGEFEIRAKGGVDINELSMAGRQMIASVTNIDMSTQLAEKYDCDPQYMRELISAGARDNQYALGGVQISSGVSSDMDFVATDPDVEIYCFYVSVKGNDRMFTQEVINQITEYLQKQVSELLLPIDYSLVALPPLTYEGVDSGVISSQNDSRARMYDYSDKLTKSKTVIDNLEKARAVEVEEIEEKTGQISGNKYAAMGFIGGAFLMALLLIFKDITSKTFGTEKEFRSWFILNNLGTAPTTAGNRKQRGLGKKIMEKLEGSSSRLSEDAFYKMTSTNIANVARGSKGILLTGSVGKTDMDSFAEKVKPLLEEKSSHVAFVFAEDILGKPETRDYLQEVDGIVFLEKRNSSKVENIREEIEVVSALDKKILGVVLL